MASQFGFTAPQAPKCRTCSTDMQEDTRIAPVGNWDGLSLYTCATCGASASTITSAKTASKKT